MESLEDIKFLGIKLINSSDFFELALRLALNTLVVFLISNKVYLKNNNNREFYFGYNTIAIVTFLMCFLLSSVKLELGFALGLFALFTIIRFRTGTIPIKEMTYLFVVIGIAVINALANKKVSYTELLFLCVVSRRSIDNTQTAKKRNGFGDLAEFRPSFKFTAHRHLLQTRGACWTKNHTLQNKKN